jgi:C4-dicarboxylate-specific signal transduction histidine kinase
MENYLNIMSIILLCLAIGVFIFSWGLRKKGRAEFQKMSEELKLKQKEFNDLRLLAAGVTHEINNAISVVIGRVDLMLRRNEDPLLEKSATSIRNAAYRIHESVTGLRQFIYPDTKEVEEFIDLSALVADVMKLAGQRLRNHGIEVKLRGLENKIVRGRKSQLEQLIINLLNQSIQRLEGGQEKWVQIVVADEEGRFNIYFMDSSGEVGDKISHKQFSDILEKNHGHLTVCQNNLVLELPKPDYRRYHY